MQNKAAIWLFTILLAIACLYQLSFSWVVGTVETDAKISAETKHLDVKDSLMNLVPAQYSYKIGKKEIVFANEGGVDSVGLAELKDHFEQEYLINIADKAVYPLLGDYGHTYQYCKNHQLNLGLDLQGGMSVTLEVSMLDLVETLAGRQAQSQSVFMEPYNAAVLEYERTNGNFIDIFKAEWDKIDASQKMTRFFSVGSKDLFDDDLSNDQVVEVLKTQAKRALEKTEEVIMARINKFGVSQPNVSTDLINGLIHLELPGVKDVERARKLIVSTANLEFWETSAPTSAYEASLNAVKQYLYNQDRQAKGEEVLELDSLRVLDTVYLPLLDPITLDTIRDDSTNLAILDTNATLIDSMRAYSKAELDAILKDKLADGNRWDRLIKAPRLQFGIIGDVLVSDTAEVNGFINDPVLLSLMPANTEFLWGYKAVENADEDARTIELYSIQKNFDRIARLDGDDMASADYSVDMDGGSGWQINMIMTTAGANEWEKWTEQKIGEPIAIIMDGAVYSAPNISQKISGGSSRITGRFSQDDVKDVVTVLEGGSLKIKPRIIDEAKVGPTLGQANIDSGFLSFSIAIVLVLLYMIFYYAKAGVVADIALVANIFFIIGTLASLGAALTLPGIAGIVLTIGMSVDANVLIFERIREEVRAGKGTRLAITDGYKHAYSAIVDANLTTLFTAIVLAYFGSGPIQGFAITLIIGIFTSLFSAIFITRLVFTYMLDGKKKISFASKATAKVFLNADYKFIKKRKVFYVVSALIIAGGIASLATKGLDAGVEFSGGRYYHVELSSSADQQVLQDNLTTAFEGAIPKVKQVGNGGFGWSFTTKYKHSDKGPDGTAIVENALKTAMSGIGYAYAEDDQTYQQAMAAGMADNPNITGAYRVIESRRVDATISESLLQSSLIAIVLALIVIFAYIAFRFRKWQYGLGALIAMFHDVLVVLSIFSICWDFLPFSMEIDQAFIAAILTVVGYSINDTVVVFDRIREYLGVHRKQDHKEVINKALNSTLSRTINTSLSTFIVLLVIFIFADSIKGFTFALMIGVVVGTYSSLCIATPSVVDLSKDFDANSKKKKS